MFDALVWSENNQVLVGFSFLVPAEYLFVSLFGFGDFEDWRFDEFFFGFFVLCVFAFTVGLRFDDVFEETDLLSSGLFFAEEERFFGDDFGFNVFPE